MTTCTIPDALRGAHRGGFTLVEVMSGLTLSAVILGSVLSTFLLLARSGANAVANMTLDTQTSTALQYFARDARMASALTWNGEHSVTLIVPDNYGAVGNRVTYAWDNTAGSATYRCFYRKPGDAGAAEPRLVLARNVAHLAFTRYDRLDAVATQDEAAKRIGVSLALASSAQSVPLATDQVTASYILRNKRAR